MQDIKLELLELLRRNDLLRATLLASRIQHPSFDPAKYVDRVMEMSAKVWHKACRTKHDPVKKALAINHVLFNEYEFQGKSEKFKQVIDDPNRYYLNVVMDKKVSSPLTLTLLYAILADQVGLQYECLALPSYYLLKVNNGASDFYIDPFDHGKFLNPEDFQKKFRSALQKNRILSTNLFERIQAQQMVSRLIQQLKHIYILKGNGVEALRAVEILTAIFPESPELTRDRGILYCEMEYFSKAIDDLRFYLKERPNAEDVGEIKKLASMLRGYREIMN